MKIQINGQEFSFPENASLQVCLEQLEIPTQHGVAVCHNEDIVPQHQWPSCTLKEGDVLEIIQATQGG